MLLSVKVRPGSETSEVRDSHRDGLPLLALLAPVDFRIYAKRCNFFGRSRPIHWPEKPTSLFTPYPLGPGQREDLLRFPFGSCPLASCKDALVDFNHPDANKPWFQSEQGVLLLKVKPYLRLPKGCIIMCVSLLHSRLKSSKDFPLHPGENPNFLV